MARRNRRRSDDVRPLSSGYSNRRREGDYIVQSVSGSAAGKAYVCPGCSQTIAAGMAHVVAWSDYQGPASRRHWHSACWNRFGGR
jgi:hypothetical protein